MSKRIALLATVVGALAATAFALALIREQLRGEASLSREELISFLRYLRPVAAGLVGIALLTHVDILVVKAGQTHEFVNIGDGLLVRVLHN